MFTYQNPILHGYNPDPSIIRVGEDYYMVTSTFEFFPGVPIYHSRNLVNWELINYCLTDDEQLPLHGARNSGGIFAPTLRFHEGVFYMITTNVTDKGNFIVHTRDIRGKWSKPAWIAHKGIDPSLFFDGDGKVYFCGTAHFGPEKSGIGMAQIDPMTGELKTPVEIISRGCGGKHPEAPHLYKIGGWYYLMIAEGGTEYGHMETLQRAKSPYGPYAPCPHNPILSHRDNAALPIQATGHADFVEDTNGNWWLVCLGVRPLGHALLHNLGRESFLAPVTWNEDGWPVVGDNGRIALDMQGPLPAEPLPVSLDFEENFAGDALNLHWNHVRNPVRERYEFAHPGLLLKAEAETLNDENPTLVAVRQKAFCLRAQTSLTAPLEGENPMAGLTAYYNKDYHYEAYITREGGQAYAVLAKHVHDIHHIAHRQPIEYHSSIELALDTTREGYFFSCRLPGGEWIPLGGGAAAGLCTEGTQTMTFTGTYIGLFASGTQAGFERFSVKEVKESF